MASGASALSGLKRDKLNLSGLLNVLDGVVGRYRGDIGEIWARSGRDLGEI